MKRALLFSIPCLFLAGCSGLIPPPQSDSTRYFVLAGPAPQAAAPGGRLRVGLKAVGLSAYLKSPDIIVRRGANEIIPQDYARWGESLDSGISRILEERLRASDGVGRVVLQPFPLDSDRDCDIAVTILRCEGGTGSGSGFVARFEATVEITTGAPEVRVVARRTFIAPEAAWDGRDFSRLAALLSADADALGREIAAALPLAAR